MLAEEQGCPRGEEPSSRLPQLLCFLPKHSNGGAAGWTREVLPPPSGLGLWPRWTLSSHLGMEPRPSPHPPADPGHSCRRQRRGGRSSDGDPHKLGETRPSSLALLPFLLIEITAFSATPLPVPFQAPPAQGPQHPLILPTPALLPGALLSGHSPGPQLSCLSWKMRGRRGTC